LPQSARIQLPINVTWYPRTVEFLKINFFSFIFFFFLN
jgi:hypothetical protein